ncbi:MAG: regulator [Phycisphaerae bacterium]
MVRRLTTALLLIAWLTVGPLARAVPPFFDRWESFDTRDGLPSDKALCVYAASDAVWVGTDKGLARWNGTDWKTFDAKAGLAHAVVMAIAQDGDTGDLWLATLGGLSRLSGGRFDTFTQLNSGLPNDVVYGLVVSNGEVWAATAAGTGRYEIDRKRWTLYDQTNTPMHEIWCYAAAACRERVLLGVWGGGLLEYDRTRDRWKDYRDPDREMEIDLFRNDGLVHDVVASVACDDSGVVWTGTYFGLSTYDGRKWLNFMDHDPPVGGLVSNFINFVTTRDGMGWVATDNGLNATDRGNWWTYQRDPATGEGVVLWAPADGAIRRLRTATIFPHNYIYGISFRNNTIWLATDGGVARGRRSRRRSADATEGHRREGRSTGKPEDKARLERVGKGTR